MNQAIALLLAFATLRAAAEPRNELERASTVSRRFIMNREVDISPLIKWRARNRGDRPLTAWHYMTGRILSEPPNEWVMEVQIEGEDDTQKIILRHPPIAARTEYYLLKDARSRLLSEARTTAAEVNAALESKADARLNASSIDSPDRLRTSKDLQTYQAKQQAEKQLKKSAAAADSASEFESAAARRLHQFDNKGYDLQGEFKFSGYALKTKEVSLYGLPVFDHGILVPR